MSRPHPALVPAIALLVLLVLAAAPAPGAHAYSPPTPAAVDLVGVGDQHVELFAEPHFVSTGIRRVRYFVPWNAIDRPDQLARVRAYVRNARAHGADVLMHVYTNDLRVGRGHLPTPAEYRRSVGRLVRALRPYGVRTWGVWNEANHKSEPTYRRPDRAAQYFAIMRQICRGCRIVALDVLDIPGVESYIDRFYAALSPALRAKAALVGIHAYGDVNRGGVRRTTAIFARVRRHVRSARFWLTETGGLVYFPPNFPCSVGRAAHAINAMFDLLEHFRSVERIYIYNWLGTDCQDGFDAGLLSSAGHARSGYVVLRRRMAEFRR